jgi:hypothetical protein
LERYLHLASINTKKADTTFCYLYGRMLLIVLHYALCPHIRHHLWVKKKRELSVRKLVRHFQALTERWRHAIFQSEFVLRRFLNGPGLPQSVWWSRRHENDTPRLKSSEKVWQNKTKPSH